MTKKLEKMIDSFLQGKKKSGDDGWPEVTYEEVHALHNIVAALRDAKWERDCDGDHCLEIRLIDRTKFEHMAYLPVPYEHKAENAQEYESVLRAVTCNLAIAQGSLDTQMRVLNYYLREGHIKWQNSRKQ